ncbi:integral membrane protein [Streptomyces laurentii]|uniref:Integral membrane protein n=1 Tax=Streptomyces laurentii TaxID=39478 RepID=A0A160P2C3_STRLU|nr:integral membrane protein [Streptomyces laurentii]
MAEVARRPIALLTAAVLFLEAPGIVAVNAIMARFVRAQSMSLDGLDPELLYTGTWALGIGSGALLLLCALVPLIAAIRDRRPGRAGRALLVGCAVVHGLLGAVAVGLLGWLVFGYLMLVVALIVLTLVAYGETAAAPKPGAPRGEGPEPAPEAPAVTA